MNVYEPKTGERFGPVAAALSDNAARTGQMWFAAFNGRIVCAAPGDTSEAVTTLYHSGGIYKEAYVVVAEPTLAELEAAVNLMIAGRFVPTGGLFEFAPYICQAMLSD